MRAVERSKAPREAICCQWGGWPMFHARFCCKFG